MKLFYLLLPIIILNFSCTSFLSLRSHVLPSLQPNQVGAKSTSKNSLTGGKPATSKAVSFKNFWDDVLFLEKATLEPIKCPEGLERWKKWEVLSVKNKIEVGFPEFVNTYVLACQAYVQFGHKSDTATPSPQQLVSFEEPLQKLKRQIVALQRIEQNLDYELLLMTPAFQGLKEDLKTSFFAMAKDLTQDDKLFEVLKKIDAMLPMLPSEAASSVFALREAVLLRIELLFAKDVTAVENRQATGREKEAREQLVAMKARFPYPRYEERINALLNVAPTVRCDCPANSAAVGAPSVVVDNQQVPAKPVSPPAVEQNPERLLIDARAALDAGLYSKAVDILDNIPTPLQTERTKRLRREAVDTHVRELRARVRDLYIKAPTAQVNKGSRRDVLKQCKQVLEQILSRYPDTTVRVQVERNLRNINLELDAL